MNTKLAFFSVLALCATASVSCEKDDHFVHSNDAVLTSFSSMYPDVKSVEWEIKSDYFAAEFFWKNREAEAWFDQYGTWLLTETDIPFEALPDAVKTAFRSGDYGSWKVEDVDMVERKDMETIYVIETENGRQEYDLYYTADGTLIKEIADSDNNAGYLPPAISKTIEASIAEKYPGARIVETEYDDGFMSIDILDGKVYRDLKFDASGSWVYTQTEVRWESVPEKVKAALAASEYAAWRVDDVDFYQTPEGDFYRIELEKGDTEVHLDISPEGVIRQP